MCCGMYSGHFFESCRRQALPPTSRQRASAGSRPEPWAPALIPSTAAHPRSSARRPAGRLPSPRGGPGVGTEAASSGAKLRQAEPGPPSSRQTWEHASLTDVLASELLSKSYRLLV